MKKTLIICGVSAALIVAAVAALFWRTPNQLSGEGGHNVSSDENIKIESYKDATYIIEGRAIKLKDGVSEIEQTPGSVSKIVTRYFGNEIWHDFNGDGKGDVAFILTQQTGGSGTFYYLVASLNTGRGFNGSHGFFLGDRIAPQPTGMSQNPDQKDAVVVNYAERREGESFAAAPSVGRSRLLLFNSKTMQFGEIAADFEGEANPSLMKLNMKTWIWVAVIDAAGKKAEPKKPRAFTVTFENGGRFSATTDCNAIKGNYTTISNTIAFGPMVSTKMYCEGSEEVFFSKLLENAESYRFTSKGELVLSLKSKSGVMVFR